MKLDLNNLPKDTDLLHQMIYDLLDKIDILKNEVQLLKRQRFSSSSEKLTKSQKDKLDKEISELELRIEEEEEKNCSELISKSKQENSSDQKEKNKPRRKPLPDHLPRVEEVINPDPICNKCGSDNFRKISEDISETLDYIPASFRVIRTIRPRCACTICDNIMQTDIDAANSNKPIAKGKVTSSLLAHILVQKYCNHLPYYRQSEIYNREENVQISRSTMASLGGRSARLLELIVEQIKKEIFNNSSHIHGDDTVLRVLAPKTGKTKIARLWVYARNAKNYDGNDKNNPPAICYFYSPDRKGERPQQHLENFQGIFHADAYSGYDKIYNKKENNIIEAGCWAHTRRKFYEVTVTNEKANIANEILTAIQDIYKIEKDIKGKDPNERLKYRQQKSKKLINDLFKRIKNLKNKLPTNSPTTKAINYTLNHQKASNPLNI